MTKTIGKRVEAELESLPTPEARRRFLEMLAEEVTADTEPAAEELTDLESVAEAADLPIVDRRRIIEKVLAKTPFPENMPEAYWQVGRSRFVDWLLVSGWMPSCGKEPGVFERALQGYRCLWSCHWDTDNGVVGPHDLLPMPLMTDGQVIAEVEDVIARGKRSGNPTQDFECDEYGQRILDHIQAGEDEGIAEAKNFIGRRRPNYQHFIAPWLPPSRIRGELWHPHHGKPVNFRMEGAR
jgi:hypothetical protein